MERLLFVPEVPPPQPEGWFGNPAKAWESYLCREQLRDGLREQPKEFP